jgi:hypothetical protein
MKRSLLLLPMLLMLAGCGRTYTLIGQIVFLEAASGSSITEIVGNNIPQVGGLPIENATITIFHELKGNLPVRDSTWKTSVNSDKNGRFRLFDYATPGKENIVGLEISAPGYRKAYITYIDYMDPDEQYFLVILDNAG